MSNSAKNLDAADLDLLGELVDFVSEIGKPYAPKEWEAWTALLEARMVTHVADDQRLVVPSNAGRSLVRRSRLATVEEHHE